MHGLGTLSPFTIQYKLNDPLWYITASKDVIISRRPLRYGFQRSEYKFRSLAVGYSAYRQVSLHLFHKDQLFQPLSRLTAPHSVLLLRRANFAPLSRWGRIGFDLFFATR
jgi:hypothetical protein